MQTHTFLKLNPSASQIDNKPAQPLV